MAPVETPAVTRTIKRLGDINRETAEEFERVCRVLVHRIPESSLTSFSEHCLAIADSGWRSYESLNRYLSLSLRMTDEAQLLEVGTIGRQLSGYSYEPSLNYFKFISLLLDRGEPSLRREIEQLSLKIQEQYPHASSLVSGCFQCAAGVLAGNGALKEWLAVTGIMLEATRDELNRYMKLSREDPLQPWEQVLVYALRGEPLVYMEVWQRLQQSYQGRDWHLVDQLLARFFAADTGVLVEGLGALAGEDRADVRRLLSLAADIEKPEIIAALLAHADRLPLDRPAVVQQWLEAGLQLDVGGDAAKVAWMSLESRRSADLLEELEGQVRLEDHKRVFDLMIEAVSGRQVMVQVQDEDSYRTGATGLENLPGGDGSQVILPAWVNLFETRENNYGFYKVSIFHQLGYREFGCFEEISRVMSFLQQFEDPRLAERIFLVAEDARIDWLLAHRFEGLKDQLAVQKKAAADRRSSAPSSRTAQFLEVLVRCSLDARYEPVIDERLWPEAALLWQAMEKLKSGAVIEDVLEFTAFCYQLIQGAFADEESVEFLDLNLVLEELPEPVAYRGEMEVATVEATMKIEALVEQLEEALETATEDDILSMSSVPDPDQMELGELKKGEVSEGVSILIQELEREIEGDLSELATGAGEGIGELLGKLSSRSRESSLHRYDEWDFEISDYRARWCTLHEYRDMPEDEEYFRRTLLDYKDLSRRIRHELNKVKPEMLRKVKGVTEGEELDLERTISYLIDRKAGLTPEDAIYIQRQRKERDVSTLFLLDMSASTDDIIPDPEAEPLVVPDVDDDEYLMAFFEQKRLMEADARRIIDLEKEAVILMSEALEKLGDAYSVCGFSGYGREQVDYYLCKDFDETLNPRSMARVGGIKACRSTRMGAPIRHATRRLLETGSRIKALIIISDGYPQDHDYGADRNSREYGLMDTMKALTEAKQQGVLTYCLTVDPSGHDYLRAMCPDSQYMVIQDVEQLPEELTRVYRSLTG